MGGKGGGGGSTSRNKSRTSRKVVSSGHKEKNQETVLVE